jgi:hypothetical protein
MTATACMHDRDERCLCFPLFPLLFCLLLCYTFRVLAAVLALSPQRECTSCEVLHKCEGGDEGGGPPHDPLRTPSQTRAAVVVAAVRVSAAAMRARRQAWHACAVAQRALWQATAEAPCKRACRCGAARTRHRSQLRALTLRRPRHIDGTVMLCVSVQRACGPLTARLARLAFLHCCSRVAAEFPAAGAPLAGLARARGLATLTPHTVRAPPRGAARTPAPGHRC